jgi:hypothetical protein
MIPREGIQEAKEVAAGGRVDDLINPWERVWILGAGLVEAGEVHASGHRFEGYDGEGSEIGYGRKLIPEYRVCVRFSPSTIFPHIIVFKEGDALVKYSLRS